MLCKNGNVNKLLLLLFVVAVSIVNWIAGSASFRTERKSVAAVRLGTRVKVSSTYLL